MHCVTITKKGIWVCLLYDHWPFLNCMIQHLFCQHHQKRTKQIRLLRIDMTLILHSSPPATPSKPRMLPTIVKSQLPSPSASYKQAMQPPSSHINSKPNIKQTNNTNNNHHQQTSMLPLPSPNSNLATTTTTANKSYHQNVGSASNGGLDTLTRWVILMTVRN